MPQANNEQESSSKNPSLFTSSLFINGVRAPGYFAKKIYDHKQVMCLGSVVPPTLLRSAEEQRLATVPPFFGMKSRGFEASRGVEAAHQTPLIMRNDVK